MDDSGKIVTPATPKFLGGLDSSDQRPSRLGLANWLVDVDKGVGGLTARVFANRIWYILFGRGVSSSLDDFGAGLSSFAYLKNFNVDTLKIDGGFIRDITDNRISKSMVAAITQVAKVMELKTVAEYVESEETRKLVRDLGVDFAQGHIIGKPVALDSVLSDLSRGAAKSDDD